VKTSAGFLSRVDFLSLESELLRLAELTMVLLSPIVFKGIW
jgi:hypothetical protein